MGYETVGLGHWLGEYSRGRVRLVWINGVWVLKRSVAEVEC